MARVADPNLARVPRSGMEGSRMNVFLVYYQEADYAGDVGRTVWDNVYDSKEKAQARVDELNKEEGVEDANYERFEVK
jgi:hypothetical protein